VEAARGWRRVFTGRRGGGERELGLGVGSNGYNWLHES
jgi:hypothetical protein